MHVVHKYTDRQNTNTRKIIKELKNKSCNLGTLFLKCFRLYFWPAVNDRRGTVTKDRRHLVSHPRQRDPWEQEQIIGFRVVKSLVYEACGGISPSQTAYPMSNLWFVSHMPPRITRNAAQHKIPNLLQYYERECALCVSQT